MSSLRLHSPPHPLHPRFTSRATLRRGWLSLATVLCLLLVSGWASARERVLVCPFEGIRANQLRWRISSIVRYAGHTSLKYKAPPADSSDDRLISYARRRDVDAFVFGTVEQAEDESWTLTLTIKNSDAEVIASGMVYEAPSLGELVQLLKSKGKEDLKTAVLGEQSGPASYEEEEVPRSKPRPRSRRKRPQPRKEARAKSKVFDADSYEPKASEKGESEKKESESSLANPVGPLPQAEPEEDEAEEEPSDEESSSDESDDDGFSVELGADEEVQDSGAEGEQENPLLDLGVRAGVVSRELRYVSDLYERLRSHDTNAVTVQVDARFYPFVEPLRDNIALIASYATSVAGQVQDPSSGQSLQVSYSEYTVGARLVAPFGARYRLGADVTIGGMSADLQDVPGSPAAPAYDYTLLRSVGFLGASFGSLQATGSVGYDAPLGYGELSDAEYFPRVDGSGFEAGLSLEYRLGPSVGIEATGNFRRFVLNMNSQPVDAIDGVAEVASGVTDVYATGYLGLNISL